MPVTVYGPRYYRNEVVNFDAGKHGLEFLNYVKRSAYDAMYDKEYNAGKKAKKLPETDRPIYQFIADKTGNSYYGNIMEKTVTGILDSQKSNRKNYIQDVQDEIDSMKEKIQGIQETIDKKDKVKEAIKEYSRTGKWKSPYKKCTIKIDKDGILTGYKIDAQPYQEYEHKLDQQRNSMHARIRRIKGGIKIREQKKKRLETLPPKRAVFGSKDLYRKKDTGEDMAAWKEEFHMARNDSITISGLGTHKHGNRIADWDPVTHDLTWELPAAIGGTKVIFPDFLPKTYTEEFLHVLDNDNIDKNTIAFSFELRKDSQGREYFIVKATFELPEKRLNYSTADGVISVDTNADRLAWANIGPDGTLIEHGVIPMKLEGLSSTQIDQVIGHAVRQLAQICIDTRKPLVIEDLDPAAMRRNMKYKNPKRNHVISLFAVSKIFSCFFGQGYKQGFMVCKVRPAYTSFIGKAVHMRRYGLSVHEAAAYEIGLRYMGLGSEVPDKFVTLLKKDYPDSIKGNAYKEYFHRWKTLYGKLSNVRAHAFFLNMPPATTKTKFLDWVREFDHIFTADGKPKKQRDAEAKAAMDAASNTPADSTPKVVIGKTPEEQAAASAA